MHQSDQSKQSDQPLPLWIQSEDKFNKLKNRILIIKDNELKTTAGDDIYNFGSMKILKMKLRKLRSYKR